MEDKDKSIMDLMESMKRDADEILGKGVKLVENMNVFDQFKTHGMNASFHYADDTASGEWRLGAVEEAKALKIFDGCPPEYQDKMREIAKGFLWSLKSKRPPIPYAEDPAYEEERRINRTLDTRTLSDGRIKNTLTGEVTPAPDYEHMSDVPPDLPKSNRGF